MVRAVSSFSSDGVQNMLHIGSTPIRKNGTGKKTLLEVMTSLKDSIHKKFNKSQTIFFQGDPSNKIYLIRRGAVRLSRVYETGEEITVALLKENSLLRVSSLLNSHGSLPETSYHAVALTNVAIDIAPACSVLDATEGDTSLGLILLQCLSSRILKTEMMIEAINHRDSSSRLVGFLLLLCRDFGVSGSKGLTIDLPLSHQAIAEAIGSTRVTVTRLLGELKCSGLLAIGREKIIIIDPLALKKRFNQIL